MGGQNVKGNSFSAFGFKSSIHARLKKCLGSRILPAPCVEALFDMGRHIAAKGYGEAVTEYKEIAATLKRHNVISSDELTLLQKLAGYRNRLVHFYHEVSEDELYEICASRLGDVETVAGALRLWLANHSDLLDEML